MISICYYFSNYCLSFIHNTVSNSTRPGMGRGLLDLFQKSELRFVFDYFVVFFHLTDFLYISFQHFRIAMHQEDASERRKEIDREINAASGRNTRFEINETRQFFDNIKSGSRLHFSTPPRYKIDLLSGRLERTSVNTWNGRKFLFVQITVNSDIDLRVSSRQGAGERDPVSVASVSSAIHFDQARTVRSHHHFGVRRTVRNPHRVQNPSDVRDQNFRFGTIGVDRKSSKVHEFRTVKGTLIVNPHHRGLVHAIPGNVIDNILFAPQEFLTKNRRASSTHLHLAVHENIEMSLRFVDGMTQLHTFRACRFVWFQDQWIRLGSQEVFHVG